MTRTLSPRVRVTDPRDPTYGRLGRVMRPEGLLGVIVALFPVAADPDPAPLYVPHRWWEVVE